MGEADAGPRARDRDERRVRICAPGVESRPCRGAGRSRRGTRRRHRPGHGLVRRRPRADHLRDRAQQYVNVLAVSVFGPDTVFLFDVSRPDAPVLRGSFKCPTGNLATAGTRLWTDPSGELQCWDISSATAPRLLGRYANSPVYDSPAGGNVVTAYGQLQANAEGTRVYALYSTANIGTHAADPGKSAGGSAIFDVSGNTPALLTTNEWRLTDRTSAVPLGLTVSSSGVAAVTYYNYGVRLDSVGRDVITPVGALPTAGESRGCVRRRGGIHRSSGTI